MRVHTIARPAWSELKFSCPPSCVSPTRGGGGRRSGGGLGISTPFANLLRFKTEVYIFICPSHPGPCGGGAGFLIDNILWVLIRYGTITESQTPAKGLSRVDLDISPVRTSGRAAKMVLAENTRPLTAEDLLTLEAERGIKAKPIAKLRDSHHAICRCLASGMGETQAAIVCGMTPSRISILKADPAFQDLLSFYRTEFEAKRDVAGADFFTRAAALSIDAVEELRDRLHDDPKSFATEDLMDAIKLLADRTGNGPQTKSFATLNVNVNLADRLRLARERVGAGMEPAALSPRPIKVIDHE